MLKILMEQHVSALQFKNIDEWNTKDKSWDNDKIYQGL